MNKVKIIVVLGFLVAFGSGLVTGMTSHRPLPSPPPHDRGRWLTRELDLTPAQEQKMRQIWDDVVRAAGQHQDDARKAARTERDEAIANLLGPEHWNAYCKIMRDYEDKIAQLDDERNKTFEQAQILNKKILSPEQLKRYEELTRRREAEGHGRGPGRRNEDRATSRSVNP